MKKTLFCLNITDDKTNEIGDEASFVTETIDLYQKTRY